MFAWITESTRFFPSLHNTVYIYAVVKGYSFTFSACSYDNDCEMGTAYQFGASDHIDGNTLPIKPKLFKIELKDVTGLKMKFAELQGK